MTKTLTLTTLEKALIAELLTVSGHNGHDFGIVEEVSWDDRNALGGLLTSLQQKDLLRVHGTEYVNCTVKFRRDRRFPGGFREIRTGGHPVTQYTWKAPIEDIEALVE